jgi:hypothetical protein
MIIAVTATQISARYPVRSSPVISHSSPSGTNTTRIRSARRASRLAAAALYAERLDITSKISWDALRALSAPSLPPAVRLKLEAVILTGQKVMVPHIKRARQAHAKRRPADQPAVRMAA